MQSWHLQIASLDEKEQPTKTTNAEVNTENGAVELRFIGGEQRKPSFSAITDS